MTIHIFRLLFGCFIVNIAFAQLPKSMLEMHLKSDLDSSAVCNDGSPAKYYLRSCPRPTAECASAGPPRWIVVFADGGIADSCWNDETCGSKAASSKTSNGLNATASPNGIFATSGEANPNFYMHHTVYVPACTSDMWLGNASHHSGLQFRGRVVFNAVMRKVAQLAANASALTVAGGSGIISQVDGFIPLLPPSLRNVTKAICDGCLILDLPPHTQPKSCGSDVASCPPKMALAQGFAAWGLTDSTDSLLADRLLPRVRCPMLVQHPQFDAIQLRMLGAWPAIFPSARRYAVNFGASVRSLLEARDGGLFSFSAACSSMVANSLISRDAFACRPVQCNVSTPGSPPTSTTDSLMAVMGMFLRDAGEFQPACIDNYGPGIDSSAYCAAQKCY